VDQGWRAYLGQSVLPLVIVSFAMNYRHDVDRSLRTIHA
jgi:hypothetical protein